MNTAPVVRLASPGDLLAAVPALLGFTPTRSLVLIALANQQVDFVARIDLPLTEVDTAAVITRLLDPVATSNPSHAISVVVSDTPHPGLIAHLHEGLAARGIAHPYALQLSEFEPGAAWHDTRHPERGGTLPDPEASPVAAEIAGTGGIVNRNSDDLASLLRPDDAAALHRREGLIFTCAQEPPSTQDCVSVLRSALRRALDRTVQLSDQDIVTLAVGLTDGTLRDAALSTAVPSESPVATAALDVWLALTRATPGPDRADPAALAGFAAYMRGDGRLARLALQTALDAQPDHVLAGLLLTALTNGIHPRKLRPLAHHDDAGLDIDSLRATP